MSSLGLMRPAQPTDSNINRPSRTNRNGASHGDSNADSVKCIFSTNIGSNVKKTDLEKLKGTKLSGNMKLAGIPDRFGKDAANMPDKREQRKRDQEAGLIPFAVKLHSDIIKKFTRSPTHKRNRSTMSPPSCLPKR